MTVFSRGSEWRRWDLHIHTPGTLKNDQYSGNNPDEKWDTFYSDIGRYIGDGSDECRNIAAIGITDYLSIENYNKVINDHKLPDSIQLVIPNVEMRIQPIAADSPINIHFLFDPSIIDELESRFFANLSFQYSGTNFSATKNGLIRLGKVINSGLDDEAAYKRGIEQFVPSFDAILKVFDSDVDLRKKTIIGVSNSNNDGVSGAVNHCDYFEISSGISQLTAFRQSIYHFVDVIFSAKPCDIKYFLGRGNTDNPETVIKKCGSLKPCIIGCDAHKNADIFEPVGNKYCWIKADPTFNGLQQILYEPFQRVRIQQIKPEEKQSYYVIDQVMIDDPNFSPDPITFNDKLTCIIGGKSTGKSLLLHNLALTIDRSQVDRKCEKAHTNVKSIPKIKVRWKDGFEGNIYDKAEDKRKIIYIPQTYLNRLSDENEETTEIDSIIEDIILLNEEANKAYMAKKSWIALYRPNLDKDIYDLLMLHQKVIETEEKKKELGTEDGIKQEINKLKLQKEKLSKEASLSDEEVKNYDEAVYNIRLVSNKLERLETDISNIETINAVLEPKEFLFEFSDETEKLFATIAENILRRATQEWHIEKVKFIETLVDNKLKLQQSKESYEKIEASLHEKIDCNTSIAALSKSIQVEETKLEGYLLLDKQYIMFKEEYEKLLVKVTQSCNLYKQQHELYAKSINENTSLSTNDLEFTVSIPFRRETFCDKVKQVFDQRQLKTSFDIDNFTADSYKPEKIMELLQCILSKQIALKKGFTEETAMREILSDWYNTVYTVKMDGDTIQDMSPGKKALVLLKLLICLAESKCPILIDQPEDDLDNRSIFNDLACFIKQKKIERQIIVVTHNANIVLGGDAEEVIVANQAGKNAKNKQYKFEYRSGSIENNTPIFNGVGDIEDGILNSQGIQQHICEILEGGEEAFDLRKNKYHFTK